jgi:SAM-dependent methyltransferase
VGSIAGIITFSALSFLGWPQITWGVVVVVLYAVLQFPSMETLRSSAPALLAAQGIAAVVLLGALTAESAQPGTSWSPYHKVETAEARPGVTQVRINGTPSQFMQSVDSMRTVSSFFFLPYQTRTVQTPPADVLVIGAGTGSDTAVALEQGAGHVDAVEIDPALVDLGKARNPARPYDDPRVTVHVTDGRAFLENTDKKYDQIIFALPDSIALVAGQSGVRLESFLFTQEAIEEAKEHLKPGGNFALINFFREPFVVDRLVGQIGQAFGTTPCVVIAGDQGHLAEILVSTDQANLTCPDATWTASGPTPEASTDDHPFSYIQGRGIPDFYLLAVALILLVSVVAVRLIGGTAIRVRPYLDLFFMGAGFLLLETRNVVVFSLLFGTTWFVNALVFAGILLAVLAAIEVASRIKPRNPIIWYGALAVALVVAWAVPADWLLSLEFWPRFVVASAIAFAPVFLANLVFADRFRDVGSSTTAFGVNLLGAMLGGVLEYAAIMVGYGGLLVVAAILYALAFGFGRTKLVSDSEPAALQAELVLAGAGAPAGGGGGGSGSRGSRGKASKRRR